VSKITGTTDFSGQDSGTPASTPEAEASGSHDGGTAGVNARALHDISSPDRYSESTVFQSDDPRLHLSRMSGEDPPSPAHYRGPDRRPI
jgi:hypothetical protein